MLCNHQLTTRLHKYYVLSLCLTKVKSVASFRMKLRDHLCSEHLCCFSYRNINWFKTVQLLISYRGKWHATFHYHFDLFLIKQIFSSWTLHICQVCLFVLFCYFYSISNKICSKLSKYFLNQVNRFTKVWRI